MTNPEQLDPDSESRPNSESEHVTPADIRAERIMLDKAIGGWRGLFDSGAPTLVFVIVYLIQPDNLQIALWSALTVGITIAVYRLIRKDSLQQVITGLVGVGIAAGFSAWT